MSTINNWISSGSYYQLPNQQSGLDASGLTSALRNTNTPSLASQLSGTSTTDILDLSPQAKQYLSSYQSQTTSLDTNFILSSKQRQQITDVLANYKNAELTQENFEKIQDELKKIGLAPDQLAQQDSIRSFNPTQMFLNALSGKSSDMATANDDTRQTKKSNYIESIVAQWQSIQASGDASSS
ncbi:MAG: hypothetical protein SFT92_06385 [Rickettsiales bacterium]|nr:hypothetical protein [Rickettsiales bacterium]